MRSPANWSGLGACTARLRWRRSSATAGARTSGSATAARLARGPLCVRVRTVAGPALPGRDWLRACGRHDRKSSTSARRPATNGSSSRAFPCGSISATVSCTASPAICTAGSRSQTMRGVRSSIPTDGDRMPSVDGRARAARVREPPLSRIDRPRPCSAPRCASTKKAPTATSSSTVIPPCLTSGLRAAAAATGTRWDPRSARCLRGRFAKTHTRSVLRPATPGALAGSGLRAPAPDSGACPLDRAGEDGAGAGRPAPDRAWSLEPGAWSLDASRYSRPVTWYSAYRDRM